MKLDAHPKSMALIMLALGISGIGIILTIAFFSNTIMLGLGVTLGILGAAAAILGCIHRMSRDDIEFTKRRKKTDKYKTQGIAPERIPSPAAIEHDASFERADADRSLYYEPCSVSPERGAMGDDNEDAPNHFILNTLGGNNMPPAFPEGSPNDFMRIVPRNDYLQQGGNATINNFTPQQSRRANVPSQMMGGADVLSPYHQRSFPVPQQFDASRGVIAGASPVARRSNAPEASEGYPHWSPQ